MRDRHGISYHYANGLDLVDGYAAVEAAVADCRSNRRPVFLHLKTTRLMGHAGTDFEIEYRSMTELDAAEARDPLKTTAEAAIARGLMTPEQGLQRYSQLSERCLDEADREIGRAHV